VGSASFADGTSKALLWKASGGAPTVLPSTSTWADAHAIGDDGTVVGSLEDGGTPYAWGPDGRGRALPGLDGSAKGGAMGAAGDYVFGHVGTVQTDENKNRDKNLRDPGAGEPRWVRWQLSTGAVVPVAGGLFPTAVDAAGALVGSVTKGAPPKVTTGPARWSDGKVVELPGPGGKPGFGYVSAVSRDGTRLAGWTGDVDAPTPTVWRC
jgi:hypothetical protein